MELDALAMPFEQSASIKLVRHSRLWPDLNKASGFWLEKTQDEGKIELWLPLSNQLMLYTEVKRLVNQNNDRGKQLFVTFVMPVPQDRFGFN